MVAKDKIATSLRAQVSPALVEHMTDGKCFIVIIADLTSQREYLWLSVLNVERKSALLRRRGKWLEDQTRMARNWSLQLGSSSIVEKLSELP